MSKYIAKGSQVDAFQWQVDKECPKWANEAIKQRRINFMNSDDETYMVIDLSIIAKPGDWIVKKENGAIISILPNWFEYKYEKSPVDMIDKLDGEAIFNGIQHKERAGVQLSEGEKNLIKLAVEKCKFILKGEV